MEKDTKQKKLIIGINTLGFMPNHRGGVESVFFNLVKGFNNNGYSRNIIYFCYPDISEEIVKLSPDSKIVIVDKVVQSNHEKIYISLIQSFCFQKIYKKYKLDVLLFANAGVGLFKYKIPTMIIPHDIQNVSRPIINKNRLMFWLNYVMYYRDFMIADKIVAISNQDKKEIEKHYNFTKKKTVKIYDPLDIETMEIDINDKKKDYILAVNIQYEHKNIATLIQAFDLVKDKYPKLKLYLAGAQTEYTKKLVDLVSSLGLSERVKFLGFVDKEVLVKIWKSARLYINPSLYEGFGMTSVESILYGAPTLLGDLEVNKEVTDGKCFFYKSIEDANDLAKKIEDILERPYDIDMYYEKAVSIREKYNLNDICKQYIEELKDMM